MVRRAGGGLGWCGCALALAASSLLLGGAAAFERDGGGEARVRFADVQAGAAAATPAPRRAGKMSGSGGAAALVFAEALRQLLERHLLGVCDAPPAPAYAKYEGVRRGPGAAGNSSGAAAGAGGCAAKDPRELSVRLAELALRASMLSRSRACDSLLSVSLEHALGDLARKASRAPPSSLRAKAGSGGAAGEGGAGTGAGAAAEKKPRKLSKSQKSKLQAKQKTALAVKKKAAAAAAATAALLNNKLRSELPLPA